MKLALSEDPVGVTAASVGDLHLLVSYHSSVAKSITSLAMQELVVGKQTARDSVQEVYMVLKINPVSCNL